MKQLEKLEQQQDRIINSNSISIWNLMPQVNEDLLDHNLRTESGILRNWEDEQLDISLRDMRISESGVMTEFKSQAFNKEFNQVTNDAF